MVDTTAVATAVAANTVSGGPGGKANTPVPVDYGNANHVPGRATGRCTMLG